MDELAVRSWCGREMLNWKYSCICADASDRVRVGFTVEI